MSNRFEFKTEAEIAAYAEQLATALGAGWIVGKTNGSHYAELRGSDGIIYISTQYGDKNLRIAGHFPYHSDVRHPNGHSIGVNPARPFVEIAREIKRRLLPDFRAAREEYFAAVQAFEKNKADDIALAAKLAKLAGVKQDKERNEPFALLPSFWTKGGVVAKISHGKVSFERFYSVSPKVAAKIVKALSAGKD